MSARGSRLFRSPFALLAAAFVVLAGPSLRGQQDQESRFRFKTGVELVNVTATVTDASGRFVPRLTRDDFVVFEDGVAQPISHFSNERVPVSLGIALDTSGSMAGDKIRAAQAALGRFLNDLLGPDDEIFLYQFSDQPMLVQDWTADRDAMRRQLGRITPRGETALYDTVAESVPMAQTGQNRKKALVIISDGNDNNSRTTVRDLQQLIRESEVLVYAIGIDAEGGPSQVSRRPQQTLPPIRLPLPFPFPGGRRYPPGTPQPPRGGGGWNDNERVNESALRGMTDESGGRTEIVRSAGDLDPATAGIADELSQQYFFGYAAGGPKDGRWHTIRVEMKNRSYHVRARRGYVAS